MAGKNAFLQVQMGKQMVEINAEVFDSHGIGVSQRLAISVSSVVPSQNCEMSQEIVDEVGPDKPITCKSVAEDEQRPAAA
jgi:hypothetical protein